LGCRKGIAAVGGLVNSDKTVTSGVYVQRLDEIDGRIAAVPARPACGRWGRKRPVARGISLRRDFPRVALECVTVMGGVLLIIGVARGLVYYLSIMDVPATLTNWVDVHIHSKYVFLILLNLVLLIEGSFMDVFSAIIVMVPLIQPLAARFGINPVQMGVIFLANLELGYLAPPIGMNLCLSAYRFRKPLTSIYRATLPVYLILLAGVLLITYVPQLTTWPVEWLGF
jgi:TRAP-type C4-dicarboxylate transport system permease large subunit